MIVRGVFVVGVGLLLGACAHWEESSCTRFKQEQKQIDYSTHYRMAKSADGAITFPWGKDATVREYQLRVEPAVASACTHLTVHKQFYLHKKSAKTIHVEEVREFYTVNGALIASKTESIGKQLRGSGLYTGTMALPIPENAPPGRYRIVSKLVVKRDNTRAELASASVSFKVLARN